MGCHLSGTSSGAKMSQFLLPPKPLWAWLCRVFDPQDSIKELLNCILWVLGKKTAARCGQPLITSLLPSRSISLDHFIGPIQNRRRDRGAELPGRPKVYLPASLRFWPLDKRGRLRTSGCPTHQPEIGQPRGLRHPSTWRSESPRHSTQA